VPLCWEVAASLAKELQRDDFCHQIKIVIRVKKKKIVFQSSLSDKAVN